MAVRIRAGGSPIVNWRVRVFWRECELVMLDIAVGFVVGVVAGLWAAYINGVLA